MQLSGVQTDTVGSYIEDNSVEGSNLKFCERSEFNSGIDRK